MKITNCTQNNMPKQSFGMRILFNREQVANEVIPRVSNAENMTDALTRANASPNVINLVPDIVRLEYRGFRRAKGSFIHLWEMKFENFTPQKFKTLEKADLENIKNITNTLVSTAKRLAKTVLEEQAQRIQEAARIEKVTRKIRDARLI